MPCGNLNCRGEKKPSSETGRSLGGKPPYFAKEQVKVPKRCRFMPLEGGQQLPGACKPAPPYTFRPGLESVGYLSSHDLTPHHEGFKQTSDSPVCSLLATGYLARHQMACPQSVTPASFPLPKLLSVSHEDEKKFPGGCARFWGIHRASVSPALASGLTSGKTGITSIDKCL